MTIKSEISRARYVGNGVTTNFAINFSYLTNNDGTAQVAVYVGNSDTPLVEGKDYTVSGIGAYSDYSGETDEGLIVYETRYEGGEVIFVNAPADQEPVAIVRDVPQTQGVVFTEGEDFPAQDFENSLDKLTMEVQQIKENLQRAIVLPPTSNEKPLEARDAILAARDEAVVSAKNALVSETNAKESENITVAAKDLIVNDAGVQAIGADLLGENKIGYVAENLEGVADNVATAVQAATAATEAAQIASDAAANAKATIEAETETAKENLGDFTDEKITQINETTNNAVSYVNENIEKSRIWAEGEQAEVEPLGGSLSSMGAADLAYALANAPEDTPIDASGLFAMNVVKGPKGDKGDKGEDGKEFDALNFLNLIYPVGSIYISTTSTCPIQDFGIGTWELVAADRVLQGAGTRGAVGTQLAESLPQHTHTRGSMEITGTLGASGNKVAIGNAQSTALGVSGVFTQSNRTDWLGYAGGGGGYSQGCTVTFTASRNWTGSTSNASGSTYQSNAKVQQDAYLVNIFRRVA